MDISINAIGKIKKSPELELIELYKKRFDAIAKPLHFHLTINEYDTVKVLSGESLKQAEAQFLCKKITDKTYIIALDEKGEHLNSQDFATMLQKIRDDGVETCTFMIGGAEGLHKTIKDKANKILCFGKLTFPHMLMRVLITEQLYRAATILTGHPYHKI
jgi:23S rRNA (pseudouridine1915-N3)-methyltransferase